MVKVAHAICINFEVNVNKKFTLVLKIVIARKVSDFQQ